MSIIYLSEEDELQNEEIEGFFKDQECHVKWFSIRDGYGFVCSNDNKELENVDIFLHYSKIDQEKRCGQAYLRPGDVILCDISKGSKGPQVEKINEYLTLHKTNPCYLVKCEGSVKWFNAKDDFGFIRLTKIIDYRGVIMEETQVDLENKKYENSFPRDKVSDSRKYRFKEEESSQNHEGTELDIVDEVISQTKDIFIPGKKIPMMGISKTDLVQGRECICSFLIDEHGNRICQSISFED